MLMFNSRLKLFPKMLKSMWSGSFVVTKVCLYSAMEVTHSEKGTFKDNGHRLISFLDVN